MALVGNFKLVKAISLIRYFSQTPVVHSKQWRISQGLSSYRNKEGILTDGPDYTYLDGRPTPLLHKQKFRMLKHREYASKIVALNSELKFAKDRYQQILKSKEEEKINIINNRLKPKGNELYRKK